MIPAAGWRAAFVAGGALPGVLALFLLLYLPESPGFLSLRERAPAQLTNRAAVGQLLKAPYVQAGLYGLASSVYPTWCRATGIGIAGSVGRVGAIASAYGGGAILSLASGVNAFLVIVALLFVVSGLGVWLVSSGDRLP